jgi:hypothetical protein
LILVPLPPSTVSSAQFQAPEACEHRLATNPQRVGRSKPSVPLHFPQLTAIVYAPLLTEMVFIVPEKVTPCLHPRQTHAQTRQPNDITHRECNSSSWRAKCRRVALVDDNAVTRDSACRVARVGDLSFRPIVGNPRCELKKSVYARQTRSTQSR